MDKCTSTHTHVCSCMQTHMLAGAHKHTHVSMCTRNEERKRQVIVLLANEWQNVQQVDLLACFVTTQFLWHKLLFSGAGQITEQLIQSVGWLTYNNLLILQNLPKLSSQFAIHWLFPPPPPPPPPRKRNKKKQLLLSLTNTIIWTNWSLTR